MSFDLLMGPCGTHGHKKKFTQENGNFFRKKTPLKT